MPRNMSFALTTEQFKNRTKTVTRRLGWKFLKTGDVLMGVEKCQGIKKGELVRLGLIEIISVRREPLGFITKNEVVLEGFPKMYTGDFVDMFCKHMKCDITTEVTRIEFKYL